MKNNKALSWKHTPGPWRMERMPELERYNEKGWEMFWILNDEGSLAEIRRGCEEVGGSMEANASLIASAPELLEACKNALAWLGHGVKSDNKNRASVILEQAIAKAEGRV